MSRKTAVAVLAGFLAVSIVSPAAGGPSLSSVAKTAKRALTTAKSADKKARQALNSYGVLKTVEREQEVAAFPGNFADFDVRCPRGYVPTGHGAGYGALDPIAELPVPNGYIGSMSNLSGSEIYTGSLYVICTYGDWSSTARTASVEEARAELARLKDETKRAAR